MRALIVTMCGVIALSAGAGSADPLAPTSVIELSDASERLKDLGAKARRLNEFRCTMYVSTTDKTERSPLRTVQRTEAEEPKTTVVVADVYYDKTTCSYRSEQVGREGITNLLINERGAFLWSVTSLRLLEKPMMFPRESYVKNEHLTGRGLGTAFFMVDALDAYDQTLADFHVSAAPKSKADLPGTAWFVLTPKADCASRIAKGMLARREREDFSLFIGVSVDTGLLVQVKIRGSRQDVDQRAVEIQTDLDDEKPFELPEKVTREGVVDAKTEKVVELD